MRDCYADATALRMQATDLPDANPVKLCILTLACIAECYAAALPEGSERTFRRGAAQAATVAAERLLISSAASIRAIIAERDAQNEVLLRIVEVLTRQLGSN